MGCFLTPESLYYQNKCPEAVFLSAGVSSGALVESIGSIALSMDSVKNLTEIQKITSEKKAINRDITATFTGFQ